MLIYIEKHSVFVIQFLIFAVHALNSFKEGIYEDPFLVLSNWIIFDSDPCNWLGVTCSGNQVTKL